MNRVPDPVRLTEADVSDIMEIQKVILRNLPSPRWYYPSTAEEFAQAVRDGIGLGIRQEDGHLAAFCIVREGSLHPHGYARAMGEPSEHTLDFEDIMVLPEFRRRGIHSLLLEEVRRLALRMGCRMIYATVDPDNVPSYSSFEKAGYRMLALKDLYDGRPRRIYGLPLTDKELG